MGEQANEVPDEAGNSVNRIRELAFDFRKDFEPNDPALPALMAIASATLAHIHDGNIVLMPDDDSGIRRVLDTLDALTITQCGQFFHWSYAYIDGEFTIIAAPYAHNPYMENT